MHAIVLGLIQGLTEFLPVSSSAHLIVIPWLLHWDDPGLAFDVALHLGTLLALLVYYWRDWWMIAASLASGDPKGRRLLGLLVAASVPAAIIGFAFEKQAETSLRSPLLIAGAMAALGVVLWIVDVRASQVRDLRKLTVGDAIAIGAAQAVAIVPGVSRSGATITMARILGIERADAANFSFLMSAPVIAGAGMLKLHDLIHAGSIHDLVGGFAAAAVFGLLAIVVLINYVRNRSYGAFALYRLLAAAFIVAAFLTRG
ncbi:MAG TPA: undecaprenyl-diphosphate phosphatase [Candidatus Binataceae bacterium]|nr:undecaprenyl-diphosphate phosphatase [Candidatus Binataceae bacterium]